MEKLLKKWIKQLQKGINKEVENELVSFFYREIYAYVYKQTIDKELSMDLTQEIFVNMLQSIVNYDEKKANFRTWLYKIATYKLVDYYRSRSYRYQQISEPLEDDWPDEEDFAIHLEYKFEVERISEFVKRLDSSRQQIFRLKLFGDYSFIQIANIMEIPESTVKTKYYTTLKLVQKEFNEGGIR